MNCLVSNKGTTHKWGKVVLVYQRYLIFSAVALVIEVIAHLRKWNLNLIHCFGDLEWICLFVFIFIFLCVRLHTCIPMWFGYHLKLIIWLSNDPNSTCSCACFNLLVSCFFLVGIIYLQEVEAYDISRDLLLWNVQVYKCSPLIFLCALR